MNFKVIIGERREQGVRMGSRCFWDSNTDNQASEYITNVQFLSFSVIWIMFVLTIFNFKFLFRTMCSVLLRPMQYTCIDLIRGYIEV